MYEKCQHILLNKSIEAGYAGMRNDFLQFQTPWFSGDAQGRLTDFVRN